MRRIKYTDFFICLFLCLVLIACTSSTGKEKVAAPHKSQGVNTVMTTYSMGRFSMKVPVEMKLCAMSQIFRACEIQDFAWQQGTDHERERTRLWDTRIAEIETQRLPRGISKAIMDLRVINRLGVFAKGVFYYGDDITTRRGSWDVLVDTGATGIWIKFRGDISEKEEMLKWVIDIARAYKSTSGHSDLANSFNLRRGAIHLPYLEQESTYARFERHPSNLKLELEMTVTHTDDPKDEGLLARTAAVIATGYATGVHIDRIRSRKRTVAGLDGEEEVDRMTDSHRTAISFGWRYAGKKDSGEYPEIAFRMESPDGELEEKLKIWDAILESMRPMYKN